MTMSILGEVRPEHDPGAGDDRVLLHYLRSYRQPVLEVWSACTAPAQLERWLGKVSGGGGNFTIELLDGPIPGPVAVRVDHCAAPHELVIHIDGCILELHLGRVGVLTNLELTRRHLCHADAPAVGPRWQYLLDRLTAYLDYKPLPTWSDYPPLTEEYR
ncbi:hypothetical protein IU433_05510 [Nocardia puris]|uniref:Activator of Hsp90 ATPase-like protein n=1 Tax=Nocardia puris TaxID=208602 RepID=A0A366E1F5_9NOCA|nr:hypothetical protein [Nocardia puris]MBF6209591.1 hypothetical protein [Nocardia puris]MBF6366163.1 hypothetical protein [Nocardia puris]MBF6458498.1 hypothetical protein [Nocardia puris]RBO96143.1 hypothetical protein DFR74_101154 [Nocardia puris]